MITPATANDALAALRAIEHLREARKLLKGIGAKRAVDKVRRALKSAEGAERHVQRRRFV
ncbi:MAG: hypothetical protein EOR84_30565 [Mesorhizobium sp.]|uniref:hypothetical protein n=1 Tax=Mesorhizobium sp. TaxID=1871066 RepID=UPI000FE5C4A5|nr:hypothetical protein [Mesorhizobium sp.]RWM32588.1 MAG: hypothetical protein EOR77_21395 [Mesorhizobium sp.]RWM86458.1 MAG: hypothetical protein EOR84_30565 [Mesorhizobium sp.]